ncbi:hypothetical protein M758_3G032500 [Ceratodon purpureus]|nr:hypothetical protein M758_3G032500 [Ceratodon purpureus]
MPFSFSSKHINFHSIDMPKKWTRTPLIKPSHLHHLSNKCNDYYHSKNKENIECISAQPTWLQKLQKYQKLKTSSNWSNSHQLKSKLNSITTVGPSTKSKEKLPIPSKAHHRSKKLMQNPAFFSNSNDVCALPIHCRVAP